MNVLEIRNLKKNYFTNQGETEAISDFSLDLKDGEFIAIVGPSGCGKSTLLSILSGLEKPTNGDINYPIKEKTKIGYMLQQDSLFPWLNILDNCLLGIEIHRKRTDDDVNYVKSMLSDYGLKDFIYSYPNNLSGGMRQRVLRMLYTHGILLKSCL